MKKKSIRLLVTGVATAVLTLAIASCSSLNQKESIVLENSASDNAETSKFVKLKMYIIGAPARNEAEGLAKINKILKEKINANLELANISWGDWQQRIPVLLASGEPFDMIYASDWAFFTTEGPKGAYYALNDLLPKYAPTVWEETPKEAWEQASINGKVYMIPSITPNFQTHGILVREDLRKKYNIPEIKSIQDFGVYLETIKKNVPGLVPYNATPNHLMNMLSLYEKDWSGPLTGTIGELVYDLNNPKHVFILSYTPEYEVYVKRQREWYLSGYWSKDILSNRTQVAERFKNEQSASTIINLVGASQTYEFVKQKDLPWELRYYSIEGESKIERASYIANGTAIYRNSPNPDRALMFLELLRKDRVLYDLMVSGIQGINYELTPDGRTKVPTGMNPVDAAWSNVAMGLQNPKFARPSTTKWGDIIVIEQEYDKKAVPGKLSGFVLNTESISAEIAAVNNVCATYKVPLDWGTVDPEKALPELRKKLKEAGIERLLAEVNKQIAEYNSK